MSDAILKSTAIEKSYDNLTIVIVAFKNLYSFYERQGKNKTQAIKIEGESPAIPPDSRMGLHSRKEEGNQSVKSKKPKTLINSSLGLEKQNSYNKNAN